jgi:hypothetical protein
LLLLVAFAELDFSEDKLLQSLIIGIVLIAKQDATNALLKMTVLNALPDGI